MADPEDCFLESTADLYPPYARQHVQKDSAMRSTLSAVTVLASGLELCSL